jgi:hypothetical protein
VEGDAGARSETGRGPSGGASHSRPFRQTWKGNQVWMRACIWQRADAEPFFHPLENFDQSKRKGLGYRVAYRLQGRVRFLCCWPGAGCGVSSYREVVPMATKERRRGFGLDGTPTPASRKGQGPGRVLVMDGFRITVRRPPSRSPALTPRPHSCSAQVLPRWRRPGKLILTSTAVAPLRVHGPRLPPLAWPARAWPAVPGPLAIG